MLVLFITLWRFGDPLFDNFFKFKSLEKIQTSY